MIYHYRHVRLLPLKNAFVGEREKKTPTIRSKNIFRVKKIRNIKGYE